MIEEDWWLRSLCLSSYSRFQFCYLAALLYILRTEECITAECRQLTSLWWSHETTSGQAATYVIACSWPFIWRRLLEEEMGALKTRDWKTRE